MKRIARRPKLLIFARPYERGAGPVLFVVGLCIVGKYRNST